MIDYLTICTYNTASGTFETEGFVKPEQYVCSIGLSSSASNDISFSVPLSDRLYYVGDFVFLGKTEFGGMITTREIDFKNKVVNYFGKSFWGIMDNYIGEYGTVDRVMTLKSEDDFPGCQSDFAASNYPNNGPIPLIKFYADTLGLPFELELTAPYDLYTGRTHQYLVPLGTSVGQSIELAVNLCKAAVKITPAEESDENILKIAMNCDTGDFGRILLKAIYITDDDDIKLNEEIRYTEFIDKGTIHYFADNYGYKSALINDHPTDLMYKGLSRYGQWRPNDYSNEQNRQELQKYRQTNAGGQVSTELTVDFETDEANDFQIGNNIAIVWHENFNTPKLRIVEKTLTMINGVGKVKYSFGG